MKKKIFNYYLLHLKIIYLIKQKYITYYNICNIYYVYIIILHIYFFYFFKKNDKKMIKYIFTSF